MSTGSPHDPGVARRTPARDNVGPMRAHLPALVALLGLSACGSPLDGAAPANAGASAGARAPAPDAGGSAAFRFDPARVRAGRVIHYVKSNLDGSKPSLVSLYLASPERIEVYKSEEGLVDSAEVSAEMDWAKASPKLLSAGVIRDDGTREERALLRLESDQRLFVKVGTMEERIDVPRLPFHVFNFDMMSLNIALPHLVAPEAPFVVTFVEPTFGERPGLLENRGPATVTFSTMETVHGAPCRKYIVSGPGMRDKGGSLWVSTRDGLLELVEIPLANNPGWNSFKLERRSEETMTPEAWETYRKTHVGTGVPAAPGK